MRIVPYVPMCMFVACYCILVKKYHLWFVLWLERQEIVSYQSSPGSESHLGLLSVD